MKKLALTAKSTASARTLNTSVTVLVADFAVFQVDETARIAAEIEAARVAAEAARVAAAQHAAAPKALQRRRQGWHHYRPTTQRWKQRWRRERRRPQRRWIWSPHRHRTLPNLQRYGWNHAVPLSYALAPSPRLATVGRRTGPRHRPGDAPNPLNPLRSPGFMRDSLWLSHAKEAAAASHFCSSPLRFSDIVQSPVHCASHRSACGQLMSRSQ